MTDTTTPQRRITDLAPVPQRRSTDPSPCLGNCKEMVAVQTRLNDGSDRMDRIEAKLDANCNDTSEVLDIIRAGKGFFRVVGWIGHLIKWAAAIGAPVLALYFTFRDGVKH